MQSSFCERGHEVWWGWLNGEELPFVRFTRGYHLCADSADTSPEPVARALRHCYRLHSEVCASHQFTPRRDSRPYVRINHYQEEA